jgi:hypothetical protein
MSTLMRKHSHFSAYIDITLVLPRLRHVQLATHIQMMLQSERLRWIVTSYPETILTRKRVLFTVGRPFLVAGWQAPKRERFLHSLRPQLQ